MPAAMLLFEIKRELHSFAKANVCFGFEYRPMRLADGWINPPCRLHVAVNGFGDVPTTLIEIGGRMLQGYNCSIGEAALRGRLDPKL